MEMGRAGTKEICFFISCQTMLDWLASTSADVETVMKVSTLLWVKIKAKMSISLLNI